MGVFYVSGLSMCLGAMFIFVLPYKPATQACIITIPKFESIDRNCAFKNLNQILTKVTNWC